MSDKLHIDATELLNNFRAAKDKAEQIEIEADLHCVAPRTIAKLLDELGALKKHNLTPRQFSDVYEPVPPAYSEPPKRKSKKDWDIARYLYGRGESDRKIAREIGATPQAVQYWRKRNGLPSNFTSNFNKAKEGKTMKKERPVEEEIVENEEQTEKLERILASGDEGKRPKPVQAKPPANIMLEPRGETETMTVGGFRTTLTAYLPAALNEAELRLNGEPVDFLGYSISVKNNCVFVNLQTREAGHAADRG